jgi:hypothetical protein
LEFEDFYTDNCNGQYAAKCVATVHSKWKKMKQRQESRRQSEEMEKEIAEKEQNEETAARKL